MKTWEVVELCPKCMGENILQWNTEEKGFVANCMHCGEKMMLCDECLHTVCQDGEPHDCDWCDDNGGVCHRDTSPVELVTYGWYDEEHDEETRLAFEVPKNWLFGYIKTTGWKELSSFLGNYTLADTMDVYARALEAKAIINEWEVKAC